jgi:hypothetical protein
MTTPDNNPDFAAWTQPGTSFTVQYSLPVFHEIDFVVNEGYRRIPHGGIEVGGILLGRRQQPDSIHIAQFRLIECEHASGPSFVLSDRDVARLQSQIASAEADSGQEGLQVVGWFIAHTRSQLKMNDKEASLFDQLFPEPGSLTVLIRPEKFKATLFSFHVRPAEGEIQRDGTQQAIILPLPGRAGRSGTESIAPRPASPPPPEEYDAPEQSVRPRLPRDDYAQPSAPFPSRRWQDDVPPPAAPPVPFGIDLNAFQPIPEAEPAHAGSKLQFAFILIVAAILGCAVGYWAYLQLPSPVIPVTLETQAEGFTLSWPAAQTETAIYAALRVNDGEPVLLSAKDRTAGKTQINVDTDTVKVELIVRHWMRDSRGIVRYLRSTKPLPFPSPSITPGSTRRPRG